MASLARETAIQGSNLSKKTVHSAENTRVPNRRTRTKEYKPNYPLEIQHQATTQAKHFVVWIDNEGSAVSLEKRKIYIGLRDAAADKHGLLRIVD